MKITLAQASKVCLDYAYDNGLMTSKEEVAALTVRDPSGNSNPKSVCKWFNTEKGCKRNPCPFKQEKTSSPVTTTLSGGSSKTKGVQCFGCKGFGHIKINCPQRSKEEKKETTNNIQLPLFSVVYNSTKPWVIDAGASRHITTSIEDLINPKSLNGSVTFTVGNDETMVPTHVGGVTFGDVTLSEVYICVHSVL